jgi:hypothetical protein
LHDEPDELQPGDGLGQGGETGRVVRRSTSPQAVEVNR